MSKKADTQTDRPAVRRGRPRLEDKATTLTALKPWKKTKPPMSRATWYARRKAKCSGKVTPP